MATLIKRVNGWTSGQATAGANGMALIVDCVNHMFGQSGDWTPAAWLLNKCQDSDRTRIRAIMGELMGGVTVKTDKKQPTGYRFVMGDNAGPSEKMELARALVDEKVSFRSKRLNDEGLLEGKDKPDFDAEKYAKSVAKKILKDGEGSTSIIAQIEKELAALKAAG